MSYAFHDYEGQKLGRLTVLRIVGRDSHRRLIWECRCDCGKMVRLSSLNLKHTRSCGCLKTGPKQDLTGMRFGRLLVLGPAERKGRQYAWECKCDCGKTHITTSYALVSGESQSCGCRRIDLVRKSLTTHGKSKSKLYSVWSAAKCRCNNRNDRRYHDYGGRGIRVCEEWNDFSAFEKWSMESGYKEGLTLDRIDNDKGYCPENCRWVTMAENALNKRSNRLITYNGETMPLRAWSKKLDMSYSALCARLKKGWSIEKTLTTPVKKRTTKKAS